MSEHSKGNALDVGRIELSNGRDIDVEKPGLFAFRTRGFLGTVRADGCEYFSTVLGPGYNYDHRNHFHFDLAKSAATAATPAIEPLSQRSCLVAAPADRSKPA